jgi:transcriptional regulator with XRE-family HTH domain
MSFAESSAIKAFAAELRAQRKKLGWTQEQLGEKIGFSGSFVSDVERCERTPALDFARACDREMGLPGTCERWHELTSREAFPAFYVRQVVPYERDAVRIHGWQHGAIPGLLQTENYCRALIGSIRPISQDADLDRRVTDRLKRQAILARSKPPLLWYVLDEAILRRAVGDRDVVREQLDHLIAMSVKPGIVIQVHSFQADNRAGADGPITVYEFSDRAAVCYTECFGGGRIVEARDEVAELVTVMNLIRASALPVGASLELMQAIRSDLDG